MAIDIYVQEEQINVRVKENTVDSVNGKTGNVNLKLSDVTGSEILPVENGGTGASTKAAARQNMNYIGTNPIKTPEEDTVANWIALGTGVAFVSESGLLNNQPYAYGYIENYTSGSYLFQTFHSLNGNSSVWRRSGNKSNGWYAGSANWVKVLDAKGGVIDGYLTMKNGYGAGHSLDTSGYASLTFAEVGGGKKTLIKDNERTGILKVVLPSDLKGSMVKFDVEVFSYSRQNTVTYTFGGQIFTNEETGQPVWGYRNFGVKGNSRQLTNNLEDLDVCFGRHNEKAAISIGSPDTTWGYCLVVVRNVEVFYNNVTTSVWNGGWDIIVDTNPLDTISNTYAAGTYDSLTSKGFTKKIKLWENDSPGSAFEGKDVDINRNFDSSKCTMFLLICNITTTTQRKMSFITTYKGWTNEAQRTGNISVTDATFYAQRNWVISEDGTKCTFSNGWKKTGGSTVSTDNTALVPLALYGFVGGI